MSHQHHTPSLPHGHAFDLQRRQAQSNAPKARLTIMKIRLSARVSRAGETAEHHMHHERSSYCLCRQFRTQITRCQPLDL